MTEDITSLQIQILYDKVEQAEKRLKDLTNTGDKAKKNFKDQEGAAASLMAQIGRLALAYVSVTTVVNQFRSAIQTTREFQKLKASLQTVVGDLQTTELVWASMLDFAKTTPFELSESIRAFQQMVATGLIPTRESMTAFGDTAAALGYKLSEMTEAVSKATVGEFEPLRKFFITARRDGDNVTFYFKGVATTVKNTAAEIQDYFTKLGQNNFAGAMDKQMLTLEGRFSNVEDAWKTFQYDLMTSTGAAEAFGDVLAWLADKISALDEYINSGAFSLDFESWTIGFQGYVTDIEEGFKYINELFVEHGEKGEETGMTVAEGLIGGIKAVVSGYRAYVKTMATILWGLVDSAVEVAKAIYQTIAASFQALINAAWNTGKAIGNALNPFSNKSAGAGFAEAWQAAQNDITGAAKTSAKAWDQSMAKIGINADTVAFNIKDAWKTAGDEIDRSAMASLEADQKAEAYAAGAEGRAKDRAARLEDYYKKLQAERDKRGSATGGGKGGKGGGRGNSEWETLEKELRDQETLISESYARRFALIEKNTRDGSAYQAELEISLTEKYEEEQRRRIEKMKEVPEKMFEAFAEEERIIEETYAKRKEIILNATELTETERLKMLEDAEIQYTASMRKHETERNKVALGMAADFFGNLSQIAGAFGKKGSKIAKAAAIAQTTIKTYEAATSAYSALAGIPYIGPALGAAAAGAAIAAGLANVAKIKAQDDSGGYSGAYAIGGAIPPGKYGLVGEAGPELVKGPAIVSSAQSTWDRMGGAQGSGGAANVEVNIINMSGEPVTEKRRQDGDKQMIEFIIGQAREAVANDISKGGTRISRAMEGTYNMSRGKRA